MNMKKRLLTMALTAMVAAGSYAYEVGDYLFTPDAKLKVEGANLVENGDFSKLFEGWTNENGGDIVNWAVAQNEGPTGEESVIKAQSTANAEGTTLTNVWQLKSGVYAISYWAFFPTSQTTSVSASGNYYVNFFANADGSNNITRAIADATYFEGEKWTEVVDTIFVNAEQEYLVFNANNLEAGTMFTNFAINKVSPVYDTRILEKKMAYAEKIASDPNFDNEEAAEAKEQLAGLIEMYKGDIEAGEMDDPESGAANEEEVANALTEFMNVSTENITLNKYFNYIEDLEDMPQYNRGTISNGQQVGGFKFRGDNWQHGVYRDANNNIIEGPNGKKGQPIILKQLQGTTTNPCGPGSVGLYNELMPAGKYFIAVDMLNAKCNNSYALTYNLETAIKGFVGTDSVELGTIVGKDYVRLYAVGELKEGETLEAGFYWDNNFEYGARWELTNFEIRAFGEVASAVEHKEAWNTFKAQYDAAANNRKTIVDLQADKANYPWAQDSLQLALNQWDPYFNAVASWVTAEGNDAGVATTDELNEWAKYQGVEAYSTNEETGEQTRLQYQVVRGYQYAATYVKEQNKPISDLAAAIENAEAIRDDGMNSMGDKTTFQTAIDAAQATLNNVKATTTDATMEADAATLATATETLAAAVETFKASAVLSPFVDIDFTNAFEPVEEEGVVISYVIKGNAGEMEFAGTNVTLDSTTGDNNFQIGYNDAAPGVLRVGKGSATVNFGEANIPTENDVIRAEFDVYFGKLTKRYISFGFQNAAGERVAGFEYSRYEGSCNYNDFNNEENTGLNPGNSKSTGNINNDAIYTTDGNKSTFTLIVDYKAQSLQGILTNTAGTYTGVPVPMTSVEDKVITKFVLASTYDNSGRRCWFDNLKIYKYPSVADGPIDTGISNVAPVKAVSGAIYTIGGVKVSNASKPGLYIQNGKKFVVK